MTSDGKKPGVAFWAIVVAVAVLVAYPLSFGPACWGYSRSPESWESGSWVESLYHPILWTWHDAPAPVSKVICWYANLGAEVTLGVAKMDDGRFWILLRPWRVHPSC